MKTPALLVTAALLTLALCPAEASAKPGAPATPAVEGEPKEGRLLVVRGQDGGEPQLTDRKGDRFLLTGAARGELLRLDGHRVKVWAKPGPKKLMTPTLEVGRYEIMNAGYGLPRVGQLRLEGDRLSLAPAKGDPLNLKAGRSMSRKLRKRLGCKVWVVTRKPGKTAARVRRFGWLSCPPDKPKKTRQDPGAEAPGTGKTVKQTKGE